MTFLIGFGLGLLAAMLLAWVTERVADPWTGGQGSVEQFYPRWRLWLKERRERELAREADWRASHCGKCGREMNPDEPRFRRGRDIESGARDDLDGRVGRTPSRAWQPLGPTVCGKCWETERLVQ